MATQKQMKTRITLAAVVLAGLSLTGCATQTQIEQQNAQLAAINVTLTQIQENQLKSQEYEKAQLTFQQQQLNQQLQQK